MIALREGGHAGGQHQEHDEGKDGDALHDPSLESAGPLRCSGLNTPAGVER